MLLFKVRIYLISLNTRTCDYKIKTIFLFLFLWNLRISSTPPYFSIKNCIFNGFFD